MEERRSKSLNLQVILNRQTKVEKKLQLLTSIFLKLFEKACFIAECLFTRFLSWRFELWNITFAIQTAARAHYHSQGLRYWPKETNTFLNPALLGIFILYDLPYFTIPCTYTTGTNTMLILLLYFMHIFIYLLNSILHICVLGAAHSK